MKARCGYSLLESMIALGLGGLLLGSALALVQGHARMARRTDARVQRSETLRIASHLLSMETRWSQPRDVRALAAESLALRAFRATGAVCRHNDDGTVLLGVSGVRAPDPDKDSILILRGAQPEMAGALLTAEPQAIACFAHAHAYRARASVPLQGGDLLLVFEPGAYYLSQRALRYRLGREGRQPLTGELLDMQGSFFVASAQGGLAWLAASTSAPGAVGTAGNTHGRATLRVRLPFLGARP